MTHALGGIAEVESGPAKVAVNGNGHVAFRGEIGTREADVKIVEQVGRVHAAARAASLPEVFVDIRELSFVNSSNIRIFVDWVMNAKGDGTVPPYKLHFIAKKTVSWQRLMLSALDALASDVVIVDFSDVAGKS